MKSFTGQDYCLASWSKDGDQKIMEFVYLAEQGPLFGTYIDEREEYDWKFGFYTKCWDIQKIKGVKKHDTRYFLYT